LQGSLTTQIYRSRNLSKISAVEIAIRAQLKRFLAHPLVVQQLEAVWSGAIVFHSVADTLHRPQPRNITTSPAGYGSVSGPARQRTIRYNEPSQRPKHKTSISAMTKRKMVTLYDPADASVFKLSRLRVPRYRQILSTLSFAIMLGLFLAVLIQRSHPITILELVFWFWSAGYMLDEVVGFSEQGFGLYIISVWNSFDIGILLMFIAYYVLRLYGILIPDGQDTAIVNMSYDVLASTAVLLFPRLFSVLDHYRYFSQLLIAFRMMFVDLAAVLFLIIISCSGFFVAFTLSFSGKPINPSSAAYALFQMLLGFTPAAWEVWDDYNFLGRTLLTVFLVISHFLILTILVSVLSNSFNLVVQNANEEHQYLFAVNTISMVKSDALFSYVPPTNIIGWLMSPVRFFMPFRQFVRLNRIIIKATHIPMLLVIFLYERLILSRRVFEPIDLVEGRGRTSRASVFSLGGDLFGHAGRIREPSISTFQKDQALEEVFRTPFLQEGNTGAHSQQLDPPTRTKSKNVVHNWMRDVGREGGASTPVNDPHYVLEHLETRKPLRRHKTHAGISESRHTVRSVASDPDQVGGYLDGLHYSHPRDQFTDIELSNADEDGDDELATNDDDDTGTQDHSLGGPTPFLGTPAQVLGSRNASVPSRMKHLSISQPPLTQSSSLKGSAIATSDEEEPITPMPIRTGLLKGGSDNEQSKSPKRPSTQRRVALGRGENSHHVRTTSSATILFMPLDEQAVPSSSKQATNSFKSLSNFPVAASPLHSPGTDGAVEGEPHFTDPFGPSLRVTKLGNKSAPNLLALNPRRSRYSTLALDLASDLGDNRAVPDPGLLSASFGTQWELQALRRRRMADDDEDEDEDEEEDDGVEIGGTSMGGMGTGRQGGDTRRLNKLVLARMGALEEGFREMLREVKGLAGTSASVAASTRTDGRRDSESKAGSEIVGRTGKETN
jgi:hypothetical protein